MPWSPTQGALLQRCKFADPLIFATVARVSLSEPILCFVAKCLETFVIVATNRLLRVEF